MTRRDDYHPRMSEDARAEPLQVVVVGGGIAALEAVLALHDLAGERVEVTLVAPESDFVLRPLAVATPFSRGHVDQLPLAAFMTEHQGQFVRSAVRSVNARARTLTLITGSEVAYDVLVLAQGASEVSALPRALTFGEDPPAFNGILADLEQGYARSVAFVVPEGNTWPLPMYELALMTAQEAWGMNMDRVELHLVTPETEPLGVFGASASAAVAELLVAARITAHCGINARMSRSGHIETGAGEDLVVDLVVALPVLEGRRLDGIPSTAEGFISVDDAGLVEGLENVYAVGDATDRTIKQGGLACQQADVAAAHIAVGAGAEIEVPPLRQVLTGRLLTGGRDEFFRRKPEDAAGEASAEPLWWPPAKVTGTYLSPYLAKKDLVHLPEHASAPVAGVDVEVDVGHQARVPGGEPDADPLRPITPRPSGA